MLKKCKSSKLLGIYKLLVPICALMQSTKLKSIRFKCALFFASMQKPCQRNQANSLESGFHMVAKQSAHLKRMDYSNIFSFDGIVKIKYLGKENAYNWEQNTLPVVYVGPYSLQRYTRRRRGRHFSSYTTVASTSSKDQFYYCARKNRERLEQATLTIDPPFLNYRVSSRETLLYFLSFLTNCSSVTPD